MEYNNSTVLIFNRNLIPFNGIVVLRYLAFVHFLRLFSHIRTQIFLEGDFDVLVRGVLRQMELFVLFNYRLLVMPCQPSNVERLSPLEWN